MDWNLLRGFTVSNDRASAMFRLELEKANNPYERAIEMCEEWYRFGKTKPKYLPLIMTEASTIVKRNEPYMKRLLTLSIKKRSLETVLRLLPKSPQLFLSEFCSLYCLEADKDVFYDVIVSLIQQRRFTEACIFATHLKLQDRFLITDFAVPLYFQDKINLIDRYLQGHKELQVEFVKILDSFCGDLSLCNSFASKMDVNEVKPDKLVPKSISKCVARLIKQYSIPLESCPNLSFIRSKSALNYVLHKKYIELQGLNDENWVDLVMETVGSNKELQKELIIKLAQYNDYEEMARWGETFDIPKEELPVNYSESKTDDENVISNATKKPDTEESWDIEPVKIEYLKLRLSRSDVRLVETPQDYHLALEDLQCYDCVGIDGEWKPCLGLQSTESKIALLQIATWDTVYLLDMIALEKCLTLAYKLKLVEKLFLNPAIIKFGYGFTSDIDKLGEFIPPAREKLKRSKNMVDFAVLYDKLRIHYPKLIVPCREDYDLTNGKTLTELTRNILGFPLDKSEQFSNWERRPLREQQIFYAALDAYCLLQLYEVWFKRAQEIGQDFTYIIEMFCQGIQMPSVKSLKRNEQLLATPKSFPPVKASEFKVVVDTMLQGLGKQLRICGIDTEILNGGDDHDKAAKIALEGKRIILTSGAPYNMLKQYVDEGMCFDVPCGMNANEQAQLIFTYYNVQINNSDIFSRCSVCNSNRYIHIPCSDMKQMWIRRKMPREKLTLEEVKECRPYPGGRIYIHTFLLESGSSIELNKLTDRVFITVKTFLVCYVCGKVYWEGSHLGRVLQKFASVMCQPAEVTEDKVPEAATNVGSPKCIMLPEELSDDDEWDETDGFYYGP